jgi:hypothetical protein
MATPDARFDLAARVAHHLAVDADQTLGDQPLGFAARADAGLAQPFVDADGFCAVIGADEGHGLNDSLRCDRLCRAGLGVQARLAGKAGRHAPRFRFSAFVFQVTFSSPS